VQLARIGPQAAPAVPVLLEWVRAPDADGVADALRALESIGLTRTEVLHAVAGALDGPAGSVAASVLRTFGRAAQPVALDAASRLRHPATHCGGYPHRPWDQEILVTMTTIDPDGTTLAVVTDVLTQLLCRVE
jgi:hypothetical protein